MVSASEVIQYDIQQHTEDTHQRRYYLVLATYNTVVNTLLPTYRLNSEVCWRSEHTAKNIGDRARGHHSYDATMRR